MKKSNIAEIKAITGKRIREARKAAGLTQEELAEKLSYKSPSTIAKLESGENELVQSKIVEIASTLGVTCGYIMGDTVQNNNVVDILRKLQADINKAIEAAVNNAIQSEETFTDEEEAIYERVRRIKNRRTEKESPKLDAV